MFSLPCSALVMLMRCAGDAPQSCTTFCTNYHAGTTYLRVGGGRPKPFSLRCGCLSGAASAHMETQTQRHTRHSGRDTDTERDAEPETYRQRHTRHTPSQSSPIASSQTQRHRDTETQRHRETPKDQDPTAAVHQLRWRGKATHPNLRRCANGKWLWSFMKPSSHDGV